MCARVCACVVRACVCVCVCVCVIALLLHCTIFYICTFIMQYQEIAQLSFMLHIYTINEMEAYETFVVFCVHAALYVNIVRGVAVYKYMWKHTFKRGSGCPFFK